MIDSLQEFGENLSKNIIQAPGHASTHENAHKKGDNRDEKSNEK